MDTKRRRLPTAAMAIAVLALIVGVTGSAIAGPDAFTSISKKKTKQIATNISKKQARKQINKRTPWGPDDIADAAVTSSKLSDEAVKGDELGQINTRSNNTTIASAANGTVSVSCDSGEKVVSGGWEGPPIGAGTTYLASTDKKTDNGWTVTAFNIAAAPVQLTVYAYCLEASG